MFLSIYQIISLYVQHQKSKHENFNCPLFSGLHAKMEGNPFMGSGSGYDIDRDLDLAMILTGTRIWLRFRKRSRSGFDIDRDPDLASI